MHLARLDIHAVRNIERARLDLSPGVSLITGDNGSGKTSLLEAIWLLGTGRSFRSNRMAPVIRYGEDAATVYGEIVNQHGHRTALGVTRERSGGVQIKVAGAYVRTASALAEALPVQLINPDSVELVTGAPVRRRRFLDWGMFHVEHGFLATWKSFRRGLEQRNALLRRGSAATRSELDAWENRLGQDAEVLDRQRRTAVTALAERTETALLELGGPEGVELRYLAGWDRSEPSLRAVLLAQRESDRQQGYTRSGPQRADLKLVVGGRPASEALSRGQQKILACALLVAQGRWLTEVTSKQGIYLVDDLPAELDREHRERLGRILASLPAQVLVTAVQRDLVMAGLETAANLATFHVEQGRIRAI